MNPFLMMSESPFSVTELTQQASFVALAAEGTSLSILRRIDETVDALCGQSKAMKGLTGMMRLLSDKINSKEATLGVYLDPEDETINRLQEACRMLESEIPKSLAKKEAIDKHGRLDQSQRELLHGVWEEVIESTATIIEAAKDFRAAIIGHDMRAEPSGGSRQVFDDPARMIDSIIGL